MGNGDFRSKVRGIKPAVVEKQFYAPLSHRRANCGVHIGQRQNRFEQVIIKIPLNLPLQRETFTPPFFKGGKGGFLDKRQLGIQFSKVKLTLTLLGIYVTRLMESLIL